MLAHYELIIFLLKSIERFLLASNESSLHYVLVSSSFDLTLDLVLF